MPLKYIYTSFLLGSVGTEASHILFFIFNVFPLHILTTFMYFKIRANKNLLKLNMLLTLYINAYCCFVWTVRGLSSLILYTQLRISTVCDLSNILIPESMATKVPVRPVPELLTKRQIHFHQ